MNRANEPLPVYICLPDRVWRMIQRTMLLIAGGQLMITLTLLLLALAHFR